LPGCRITDWPDFTHRGVLLDVSRDKVPTMETLFDLVDLLAGWKINQLQLYMEHTFAYRGHEVVWQRASPLTGDEIEALDAVCRNRYVELVPNQNSLGHMHRWLIHEPYRRLAECPKGIVHPFSPSPEPYGLCPVDPGSLALLSDLYDQLLPHFSSSQFNVGLDETLDLGQGRSAAACAQKGVEGVYLEFLGQIHRLVTQRGRTMQFWADVIRDRPALIGTLSKDVIPLEWGYEGNHPFAERGRLFADAGLRFYVCPGTSSWNSLAGRTANALANISNAVLAGRATGAIGVLTTDWGDNGHLQPLPVSYLGFVAGAAFSWNSATAEHGQLDIPALLGLHAFADQAGVMGRLAYNLGNTYLRTRIPLHNGSVPFHLLVFADRDRPHRALRQLTTERLEETRAYVDEVMAPLSDACMARPDAETILEEFRWVADMLRLACRLGTARVRIGLGAPISALPAQSRNEVGEELRTLIGQHRKLWQRRNRPGGLDDSAARLERVLALLEQ
ncbi:MAG: beta-N-acetylhexosaminidase, partial [candidate division NC10 bacterium]|nr:beta-N-acetylhexosaminidase [candidate division NC10 bacterium]